MRSIGMASLIVLAAARPLGAQDQVAYETVRADLGRMAQGALHVAQVDGLVLERDVARFTLESGRLWLLQAVNGRTVAAAFQGSGRFSFAPTDAIEQREVARVHRTPALDAPIDEVVFLFSDSTLAELRRALRFDRTEELPGVVRRRAEEMVDYLSDTQSRSPDPDVMADLLNRTGSDLFYAHVGRTSGDPVMFMLNPNEVEGVRLLGRARRVGWVRVADVVSQSRRRGDTARAEAERYAQAEVTRYTIDATIPRGPTGDVSFRAAARLDLSARSTVGPWIAFSLYPKLEVDSARAADGSPVVAYKRRDAPELWLRFDRALAPGEERSVTVYYHGDLIERIADFFFIKSSIAWYPVALEGRTKADFDMTFTTPRSLVLASVGERVDSAEMPDRTVRTRWVTPHPIRNASFNLGLFEEFRPKGPRKVSVLYSEQGHRMMARNFRNRARALQDQGYVAIGSPTVKAFALEQVGEDVQRALTFFTRVFGPLSGVEQFYATEIPYSHGEAFPGLVHLSLSTFIATEKDGFDEFFRAHEVAHQWWGIGVDYATYHDRWLSEGLSSFAGLWYLQTARGDNKRYFKFLDRWRADILTRRADAAPVWLGNRVVSGDNGSDYQILIYSKGAWVMHMLRMFMVDLATMNEDRFIAALGDFFTQYQGKRASTADLRAVMERHSGADLGWFFQQWLYSPEIPTYRVAWKSEPAEAGKYRVTLRVAQEKVPDNFLMYVPVTVDLGGNSVARLRVKVTGPESTIELPLMPSRPREVRFNDMNGVLAEVKTAAW